jgi:hypothetical protein
MVSRIDHANVRDLFFFVDNPSSERSPHGITKPRAVFPADEPRGARLSAAEDVGASPMLKVLDTGPPLGVTVAGPKLQLAPTGSLLQLKVTGALNPFCGVNVTITLAVCPVFRTTSEVLTAIA